MLPIVIVAVVIVMVMMVVVVHVITGKDAYIHTRAQQTKRQTYRTDR